MSDIYIFFRRATCKTRSRQVDLSVHGQHRNGLFRDALPLSRYRVGNNILQIRVVDASYSDDRFQRL